MGRIKTQLIKRMTKKLVAEHEDKISTDFNENKELVNQNVRTGSRKIRNIIAGYTTRLARAKQKQQ